MPSFLNVITSPQGVQKGQFRNWGKTENVKKNLFSPIMPNMTQKMPPLVE